MADGFSARDIQRKDWSHLTESHHITAGLDLLEDHHYVATQHRPTGQKGGRPSAVYLINPAAKPADQVKDKGTAA